jgi:hypothetical protein
MSAYPTSAPTAPRRVRLPAPARKKAQLAAPAPAPTRTLQPHEIEAELAHREAAYNRLMSFTTYVYPYYYPAIMHQLIASALEMVEARQIRNLLVMAPPQFGKSSLVSQFFPSWYLGRNPDHDIILCSYNASLAEQHSFRARQIFREDRYTAVFPGVQLAQRSKSLKHWRIEGRRGGMKTAGVGGGVTGFSARCLPADTLVETEGGATPIAGLFHAGPSARRVMAYNHETGRVEPRRIIAGSMRLHTGGSFIEIEPDGWEPVRATPEHPFYVRGRGYLRADQVRQGDELLCLLGERTEASTVSAVHHRPGKPEMVYDFEVEGLHNFFANGHLVHNCLIVDDPLRGWKDANSEVIRAQQINWYDSEADTRVAPFDGVRVLCFTHWHEADIGGILLKRQATGGQLWHVLRLPALAETPQQTREWCDRHNVTPDRYLVADQPVDVVAALYGSYRRRPDQTSQNGPSIRVPSLRAVVDNLMGRSGAKKAQKEAEQADFEGYDVEVGDFPS